MLMVAALALLSPSASHARASKLWAPPTRASTAPATPPPPSVRPTKGTKVAVLAFAGDGSGPLRQQVIRALRAKGFRVNAGLRSVDSPSQYREMADALGLCAYLDGEVHSEGDLRSATIRVRSARTGQHVMTATFSADRRKLPGEVGKGLWRRLGPVLAQASADAAQRPHDHKRSFMRINAGTPLQADESTD
jgi:hypothetical protein